jgi:KamA family protein
MTTTAIAKQPTTRKRVKYVTKLTDIPQLTNTEREALARVDERYVFRANEYYLGLIDWDDPHDPIRQLVIPRTDELDRFGQWDASNEGAVTVQRGVQHKYGTTVLLLVNEVCDAYCRYCFRKRLFTNDNDEAYNDVSAGLDYIRNHPEVDNVLLTGGDPLLMSTKRLEGTIAQLRQIDHVKIIRIGSKTIAFNPMRISGDTQFLDMLRRYSQPDRRIYLICHFDHPVELTPESLEAVRAVQDAGVICVNQCPVIRGVSNNPDVMSRLWNQLSYIGVPQYYIFQCRPTAGNAPYSLPITEAYFMIEEAKKKCSGLAKRIKFCMSHATGKVEIVAVDDQFIFLKYHRAKDAEDEQRFFVCHRDDEAMWLDDLKVVGEAPASEAA